MHITINELKLSTRYYFVRQYKTANICVKTAQFIKKLCKGYFVVWDIKLQNITFSPCHYRIPTSGLHIVRRVLPQNFRGGLRKCMYFETVYNGRSRLSKVVDFGINRKRVCDFLLVINNNLGPILPRFRDIAVTLLKTAPHPYSIRILGCFPWTRLPMLGLRGTNRTDRRTTYCSNTVLCTTCIARWKC